MTENEGCQLQTVHWRNLSFLMPINSLRYMIALCTPEWKNFIFNVYLADDVNSSLGYIIDKKSGKAFIAWTVCAIANRRYHGENNYCDI